MFVIVVWFARFDFGGFRLGGLTCSGSGCCALLVVVDAWLFAW